MLDVLDPKLEPPPKLIPPDPNDGEPVLPLLPLLPPPKLPLPAPNPPGDDDGDFDWPKGLVGLLLVLDVLDPKLELPDPNDDPGLPSPPAPVPNPPGDDDGNDDGAFD